ncbi:winged helix-turn-helix domain-containing protein [Halorussus amylolyticus]|uniref:winged helix-turn-helix domain-containing protein n=1 Tax=Halorussus amylolyticus TaxID=1126242 RepID=UPI001049FA23|nr:winged helix-turn-helix domain-containing protein [Halorussus amylolyticus]
MSDENPDDRDEDVAVEDDESETVTDSVAVGEGEDDGDADERDVPIEEGRKRLDKGRERLEEEADKAVDQFDQGIVDLLSWVLDTDTRARIYVYLRKHPHSTSEEIAEGTGLYPSTVRESLAELHDEGNVERRKRESEGAGNNPYEYTAIAPSELVSGIVGQIQDELNTVFNLDDHLEPADETAEPSEPVSIRVEDIDEERNDDRDDE